MNTMVRDTSSLKVEDLEKTIEKLIKKGDDKSLSKLVDRLGMIKAQLADLEEIEETICGALKATGLEVIEGDLFRATVSRFDQTKLVSAQVKAILSPAQIIACTQTIPCTQVRVKSR